MPEADISEQDLYDLILSRLSEAGAEEVANEIRRVVLHGIVIQGEEGAGEGNTKAVRPMRPQEALAVALEFLITALQVPLMVKEARSTFGCQEIIWHPDGPPNFGEASHILDKTESAELPFVDEAAKSLDTPESDQNRIVRETGQAPDIAEKSSLMPIPLDTDLTMLHDALKAVIDLKQELALRFPEVV